MIEVRVLNETHELDTLNGYYRLDDLWKLSGKPKGFEPITWMRQGKHSLGSVQVRTVKRAWEIRRTNVWANQSKLIEYAMFLCPEFRLQAEDALYNLSKGDEAKAYSCIRKVMSGVYSV